MCVDAYQHPTLLWPHGQLRRLHNGRGQSSLHLLRLRCCHSRGRPKTVSDRFRHFLPKMRIGPYRGWRANRLSSFTQAAMIL